MLFFSWIIVISTLAAQSTAPSGSVMTSQTEHLTFSAGASVDAVTPGERISLVFEVQPRRNMHVYAPGKHDYRVVTVAIDQQPWLRVHPTRYPPSQIYHFKPLDERVPVYQQPFRITKDITILSTGEARKMLTGRKDVTVTGRFEYQACDDNLCYRPQSVPLRWTLTLKPIPSTPGPRP